MTAKRRIVQIAVFLGMFIIPVLNLFEIYFIKGTFISMDIGSMGIADPVMIFQALFATATYSGVLIASAILPLLIMIFLGRVWCSWACPYTLILDVLEKMPFLKTRMKIAHSRITNPATLKRTTILRYLTFVLLIAVVGISGVPVLHLLAPPSVISTQALLLVKTVSLTVEILLILILLVIEIFFSYRFACRYFCPTGTALSLCKTSRTMRPAPKGRCSNCGKCRESCPMGLNPMTDGANRLCYNCGACIDSCPEKNLEWRIG